MVIIHGKWKTVAVITKGNVLFFLWFEGIFISISLPLQQPELVQRLQGSFGEFRTPSTAITSTKDRRQGTMRQQTNNDNKPHLKSKVKAKQQGSGA